MNLRKQLKLYLESNGLTTSQLARKSGVPNTTIADWLTGRKPRNLDQVKKVADAFNISIDHLVYGEGVREAEKVTDLESLIGDGWIGGVFEVKMRRIKK